MDSPSHSLHSWTLTPRICFLLLLGSCLLDIDLYFNKHWSVFFKEVNLSVVFIVCLNFFHFTQSSCQPCQQTFRNLTGCRNIFWTCLDSDLNILCAGNSEVREHMLLVDHWSCGTVFVTCTQLLEVFNWWRKLFLYSHLSAMLASSTSHTFFPPLPTIFWFNNFSGLDSNLISVGF